MAFSYPYLLTATDAVLISLYTFEVPSAAGTGQEPPGIEGNRPRPDVTARCPTTLNAVTDPGEAGRLPAPYLLTSLDSHTSRPPLALSIRKAAKTTIASVAYTFSTRRGWSIGIQDLHIRQSAADLKSAPEISATRIAYTTPVETAAELTPSATPRRGHAHRAVETDVLAPTPSAPTGQEPGPTTLCYSHPYLLATLPDNTLILHMCTSTASSLSISDGIRLWGHTSGISDAEITARGKAVSVSTRGEEMRVWELEGRSPGTGGGGGGGSSSSSSRSVEIRPWQSSPRRGGGGGGLLADGGGDGGGGLHAGDPARDWDERRNWVGFDDEMVIVLKERKGAPESLMVYDFT